MGWTPQFTKKKNPIKQMLHENISGFLQLKTDICHRRKLNHHPNSPFRFLSKS